MGLFKKETCFICQNEIKKKPIKVKSTGSYLCQDCYSFLGGSALDLNELVDSDLMSIYDTKKEKERISNQLKEANPMRTAEGMFDFSIKNGYDVKDSNYKSNMVKYRMIENSLYDDENVLLPFTGIINFAVFSFALTDKRFIYAAKVNNFENIKTVYLSNINDVTYSQGSRLGKITIDSIKETIEITAKSANAKLVYEKMISILRELKIDEKSQINNENTAISPADEIKKYKELLDMGILTQEEFDQKKKELLNL